MSSSPVSENIDLSKELAELREEVHDTKSQLSIVAEISRRMELMMEQSRAVAEQHKRLAETIEGLHGAPNELSIVAEAHDLMKRDEWSEKIECT
jgi:hypothetical protein